MNRKRTSYNSSPSEKESEDIADIDIIKGADNIPLPNEEEKPLEEVENEQQVHRPSILDFFKSRIHLEEIILLGLIFILLDEKIDDDFLLIMLIYILIT